jgi:nuclear transport factor 2 (NTF2) superfamily protein
MSRPPPPPFTRESTIQKVRLAEDGWNTRDPAKVALAYSLDTRWRNRAEFTVGRDQAGALLRRKWTRGLRARAAYCHRPARIGRLGGPNDD